MPPIPIYSHSPINAAKADGVTPKTVEKGRPSDPPPTKTARVPYPPAQPGAVPSLPAPTGAASAQQKEPRPEPTPTQPLGYQEVPPPPQPGAFPVPPGAPSTGPPQARPTGLPPPPKAGDNLTQAAGGQSSGTGTGAGTSYYPPQMAIPAPPSAATQGAQRGTAGNAFVPAPSPLEHPPGYQQNPTAGELNQYQRAAQEALEREEQERRRVPGTGEAGEGGGVWGSVKGAMAAAGEKIAAAEEEIWSRVNKGGS